MQRRLTMLRRTAARMPGVFDNIISIIANYEGLNMRGTYSRIPPGANDTEYDPQGPIGLLLVQLSAYNCTLDSSLNIVSRQMQGFDLMAVPWQDLTLRTNMMFRRERFYQMTTRKSDFRTDEMLDHAVLDVDRLGGGGGGACGSVR